MPDISESRLRLRADRVTWSQLDDDVVALDLRSGEYLSFTDSAAELWVRMENPTTVAALADWIVERYGIDAGRARRDVETFVDELAERELVELL